MRKALSEWETDSAATESQSFFPEGVGDRTVARTLGWSRPGRGLPTQLEQIGSRVCDLLQIHDSSVRNLCAIKG